MNPIAEAAIAAARRAGRTDYEAGIAARVAVSIAQPIVESRMREWWETSVAGGITPSATERLWRRHDIEVELSREMRAVAEGDDAEAAVRAVCSAAADSAERAAGWGPAVKTLRAAGHH